MSFRSIMHEADSYVRVYDRLKNEFLAFEEILRANTEYQLAFTIESPNLISTTLFGNRIEIVFTMVRKEDDDLGFGRVEVFWRVESGKKVPITTFYFDGHGNTGEGLDGPTGSLNMKDPNYKNRFLTILIKKFMDTHMTVK
jgi:hypothetical protein